MGSRKSGKSSIEIRKVELEDSYSCYRQDFLSLFARCEEKCEESECSSSSAGRGGYVSCGAIADAQKRPHEFVGTNKKTGDMHNVSVITSDFGTSYMTIS